MIACQLVYMWFMDLEYVPLGVVVILWVHWAITSSLHWIYATLAGMRINISESCFSAWKKVECSLWVVNNLLLQVLEVRHSTWSHGDAVQVCCDEETAKCESKAASLPVSSGATKSHGSDRIAVLSHGSDQLSDQQTKTKILLAIYLFSYFLPI